MTPKISHARAACEAAQARQAVVVFIGSGQYAVVSYGETRAECAAVKPLCDAIADAIEEGELPMPGEVVLGGRRPSERRTQNAKQQLAAIATLVSIYDRQDEPEGQVSASRVITAISETIGQQCRK